MNYQLLLPRLSAAFSSTPPLMLRSWLQRQLSRQSFSRLTIAARITVIALTLALPLNLVVVAAFWKFSRQASELQRTDLIYMARTLASAVDAKLGEYITLAEDLARSPALLNGDLKAFEVEARLAGSSSPDTSFFVANLDGEMIASAASLRGGVLAPRDPLILAEQKRAFETHTAVIGDLQELPISQARMATITVPVFKDGQPFRSLSVALNGEAFLHLLNERELPGNWTASIIDGQGRYIASATGGQAGQLAFDGRRKASDQDDSFATFSIEGRQAVKASAHSLVSGWMIDVAIKNPFLQSAVLNYVRWATALTLGLSIASILFASATARGITASLKELQLKASALLSGRAPPIPPAGPPEVSELWQSLTQSVARRDQSEQALRESEEKLRLALDAAELGIWRWIPGKGAGQMEWDSRCRALFGVSHDACITYATWANAIAPEDRMRAEAKVAGALDPGDSHDETICEYRVRHPDGAMHWLSSMGRAFFEPDPGSNSGRRALVMAGAIRDVTDIRSAEAALRESEERFRGIFEHAGTGIAITDMEGRFHACNPAFSTMLGYSEQELRQLALPAVLHPEDRDANLALTAKLATLEIPSFEFVCRYLKKDGHFIWVHKYVSLLSDTAGEPTNILVLVTDITERKRQEEQITLLMREVNHRSKNMLTVVQAVARQTLTASPEDFLDRFGKRVEALATNQDLLVKNAWRGVDLHDLVRSQLAHFEDLIGTRIKLEGPPVFISAPAAQAIGMALHELATNAGKYGALSQADGRVGISWSIQWPERGHETFMMSWHEQCSHQITAPPNEASARP